MADLSGLNLLRNDPVVAARLIGEAEQGDVDAQYAAGLIYAEGRGVEIDLVQAYFWLTRAVEQGDVDAEKLRRMVAVQMDDRQFADARRLVELTRQVDTGAHSGAGRRH